MLSKVVGRKFELFPVEIDESHVYCETCGGTGRMLKDEKWLVPCKDCYDGRLRLCPICGKIIPKLQYDCADCRPVHEAEIEAKRFEKATKIEPESEVAKSFDMMYSESIGSDEDAFFEDWYTFFERWHDAGFDCEYERKRPEYVWGTTKRNLSLDASSILENALEDFYDGASDYIGDKGYAALQDALDNWAKEYGDVTSYDVTYKVAIRIPWEDDDYKYEDE